MSKQSIKQKAKVFAARMLIKLGRLRHVDYHEQEILDLITPHLPHTVNVDVPYGKGTLTVEQAQLSFNATDNHVGIQLFCAFNVDYVGNPLYRAHVVVSLLAVPHYDAEQKEVRLSELDILNLHLVEDEYSLIKDAQTVLALFVPRPLQNLVTGTVKSALGFLTSGVSDASLDYARLYAEGSKQRILDYHAPQLRERLQTLKDDPDTRYALNMDDWEDRLFARYGKRVYVTNKSLRFSFAND